MPRRPALLLLTSVVAVTVVGAGANAGAQASPGTARVAVSSASPAPDRVARPVPPAGITGLTVTRRTPTSLRLGWTLPAPAPGGVSVVRVRLLPDSFDVAAAPWQVAARREVPQHGVTLTGLAPGARYEVSVALRRHGVRLGRPSRVRAGTPPEPVTAPVVEIDAAGVHAEWRVPTGGSFAGVVVRLAEGRRAPAGPNDGTAVPVLPVTGTAATLPPTSAGRRYAVAIWTVSRAGILSRRAVVGFRAPDVQGSGVVSGIVRDVGGAPLAGVTVAADSLVGTGPTTTTDGTGAWSLTVPAGLTFLGFLGDAAGGGSSDDTGYAGSATAVTVVRGGHTPVDTTLRPGAAVRGRVVGPAGRPVAGLAVVARPTMAYVPSTDRSGFSVVVDGIPTSTAVTDSAGGFVLKGLAPGSWQACLQSDPQLPSITCSGTAATVQPGATVALADLLAPASGNGATITGLVTGPDGGPVAQAQVSLVSSHRGYPTYVSTDADGRFAATDLAPGDYTVCAQRTVYGQPVLPTSGGVAPGCRPDTVAVTRGTTTSTVLRLGVGAAMAGRVTNRAGQPITGAQVVVAEPGTGEDAGGAVTDAHGDWSVADLQAGTYQVCVSAGDAGPHDPRGSRPRCVDDGAADVAVRAGGLRLGVDVALAPAAALSGRVTDAEGSPLTSAEVTVEPLRFGPDAGFGYGEVGRGGHFVVGGLLPGTRYRVCADDLATGHSACARGPSGGLAAVAVHLGRTTRGIDLTVGGSATLTVTATDVAGAPVAGADVVVVKACPSYCEPLALLSPTRGVTVVGSAVTGIDGTVRFRRMPTGRYAVCLFAAYAEPASNDATTGLVDTCTGPPGSVALSAGTTTAVEGRLQPGGEVTGRVVDGDGNPLRGARVVVSHSSASDADSVDAFRDGGTRAEFTTADGRFVERGVAAGTQTVCIDTAAVGPAGSDNGVGSPCGGGTGAGSTSSVQVVAGGTTALGDVVAPRPAGIAGTVRTGPSGRPERAVVEVFRSADGSSVAETETDRAGGFRVVGLQPDTVQVCAYVGDGRRATCAGGQAWNLKAVPHGARRFALIPGSVTEGADLTLRR